MNPIISEDIKHFVYDFPYADRLAGSTFLITGSTGLIGSLLVRCLLSLRDDICIIAPVRDLSKARDIFGDNDRIEFIECNLCKLDYTKSLSNIDYIVHAAAPTSSRFFVENPVETSRSVLLPSLNLLAYCVGHRVKSVVYLSSLEVYGTCHDGIEKIEDSESVTRSTDVRNSYPIAKMMVENLCSSYALEYNVPVKIARLTQVTGPGISQNDNRVIASFTRLATFGNNIVLHTTGESARPYCYTMDAIRAILYILLRGTNGEAYNVANSETYISARNLAEHIKALIAPEIEVKIEYRNDMGYAAETKLPLNNKKLQELGWIAKYNLDEIIVRLSQYLKSLVH